jgi:hypothetical protein
MSGWHVVAAGLAPPSASAGDDNGPSRFRWTACAFAGEVRGVSDVAGVDDFDGVDIRACGENFAGGCTPVCQGCGGRLCPFVVSSEDAVFHIFGLVSVSLPRGNTGSSHIPPCVQVFFLSAVHFVRLPRKRAE